MAWMLRCGNNHHWQTLQLPEKGTLLCPECGQRAIAPPMLEASAVAACEPKLQDATLPGAASLPSASSDQTFCRQSLSKAEDLSDNTLMLGNASAPTKAKADDDTLMFSTAMPKALPSDGTLAVPFVAPSCKVKDITHDQTAKIMPLPSGASGSESNVDETLVGRAGSMTPPAHLPATEAFVKASLCGDRTAQVPHLQMDASGGHSDCGQRLQTGPTTQGTRPSASAGGVSPVPGYEIVSVLGRGGMGIVYKAKHIQLDRIVALKMILTGAYSSEDDRKRFDAEAKAVAQFKHPNIVDVYDSGNHNGVPYLSLEYVEGGTLQGKLEKSPMTAGAAAAMIEILARALAYAHQKGILHRDIKPANVLLAADGTPKISDFGLAKRLDRNESLNASNAILGTPTYMPPEQALGKSDIGPGADIYSLGATLYEMLVSKPPFKGATVLDTLKQVQENEPVPLRDLQPTVPGDLQTICLKCLSKDPKHRYLKADDLADDLRNFLDGKPIHARPVSAIEKAWKWSCRNPAAASLIGVTSVSLLAFAIGGMAFAWSENDRANSESKLRGETTKEHAITIKQERIAAKERDHALAQEKIAKAQTELATLRGREVVGNFRKAQQSVLIMVNLARNRMTNERHLELAGRDLMERTLVYYDAFLKKSPNDPMMRVEFARAHWFAGDMREKLGRYEEADKDYVRGITLLEELVKENGADTEDLRHDLAGVFINRTTVLQAMGKDKDADAAFARATELLAKASTNQNHDPVLRWLISAGYSRRAIALQQRGDAQGAEEVYLQCIHRFERIVQDYPLQPSLQMDLGAARVNLAFHWTIPAPGQVARAEAMYQDAFQILSPLVAKYQNAPNYRKELGRLHLNRGILYTNSTRFADAGKEFGFARAILHELARDYAIVTDYRHLLASTQRANGFLMRQQQDLSAEAVALREANTLLERLSNEDEKIVLYRREWAIVLKDLSDCLDLQFHKEIKDPKASPTRLATLADEVERTRDNALVQFQKVKDLGGANIDTTLDWTHTHKKALEFHALQATRLRKDQPDKAEHHLQRRVALQKDKLAIAPEDATIKSLVAEALLDLADLQTGMLKHVQAAQTIQEIAKLVPPSWPRYAAAAVCLSDCMPAADKTLQGAERERMVKDYGERSLRMLGDAIRAGFNDAKFLRDPLFLAPLRARPEFRAQLDKLIQTLDKKK